MTRTRTLTVALALVVLGPLLAVGCATTPSSTRLTSPYISWSSTTDQLGTQGSQVNTCSAAGGPVTVAIIDHDNAAGTTFSIAATINVGGQAFDGSPRLTAVGESWTSQPVPAGSCFAVNLVGSPGKFRFRIDW
jgi:hypothetical protein